MFTSVFSSAALFFTFRFSFLVVDHTFAHRYGEVRRLPLFFFFSYETFNLARVTLLAIVAMIVGLVFLCIVADLSHGISRVYGDNAQFSGVRGTRVVARHHFSPISSGYPLNIIILREKMLRRRRWTS